jgi:hypothetical protein
MILFDSVEGLFDDQAGDFDDSGVVNSTITITGLQATSSLGGITTQAEQSPSATLTGLSATSSIGTVVATGQSFAIATVTGVEGVSSIGIVLALATGSGIATVSGVSATSSVGNVNVVSQTIVRGRKRNVKFLQFNPIPVKVSISAVAISGSVEAIADLTLLQAAGGVSGRAKLYAVKAQTDIQVVQAGGIINPTDEEIIFLMAA